MQVLSYFKGDERREKHIRANKNTNVPSKSKLHYSTLKCMSLLKQSCSRERDGVPQMTTGILPAPVEGRSKEQMP